MSIKAGPSEPLNRNPEAVLRKEGRKTSYGAGRSAPQGASITDDPVYRANEREDAYWQRVGGRDPEPTYREGWRERYQRVLREAAE